MRTRAPLALALVGASALCSGAEAASYTFGGSATLRAGYGKNANFQSDDGGTSAVLGGNLTATLARLTGLGRTALTGSADITQTTDGGQKSNNYLARLSQALQLNPKLSVNGDVSYSDTTNANPIYSTDARDLVPIGDVLTIGTHTREVSGDLNAAYQLDSKDLIQLGANASHSTYSTLGASDYTQYGLTAGYLRTISASTRIGVQASALKVVSDRFSSSSSVSAGVYLTQKINRFWTFQGGVNGVMQKAFGGNYKTIGFNASFCGDYPRWTVCVLGSRQSAASGIGGLRIDTQGGVRASYKLTTRSNLDFTATYDVSSAKSVALPQQRYVDTALTYSRTITERLTAGFSGRYQRRISDAAALVSGFRVTSYVGTANVTYLFGRAS